MSINSKTLPLKFTIAFTLASALMTPPAIAQTLTQSEISQEIIGRTLTARRMGMKMRMLFGQDGTVTMKAPLMSASGTWAFADNQVCANITEGPRKGRNCTVFARAGSGKYKNSEGVIFTAE